ncbi:NTP transferase domain-containing protein [Paenibacillus turpanensis]|uniref:NTP transferase domain-containing protein n=1 Tax=Paenibacillus turpanensis TaxID=2689078 RepID=UPI001407DC53|nr:NTP transferase domain-containing protein [Paenibacillus turpanensis]
MLTGALLTYIKPSGHVPRSLGSVISQMEATCNEVILVTNQPRALLAHVPSSTRVLSGYNGMDWPLGGLYAALSLSRNPFVWAVDVDSPFLSPTFAHQLLEQIVRGNEHAAFPVIHGLPLLHHAIYRKRCHDTLYDLVTKDMATWDHFLDKIKWTKQEPPGLNGPELTFDSAGPIEKKQEAL